MFLGITQGLGRLKILFSLTTAAFFILFTFTICTIPNRLRKYMNGNGVTKIPL